MSLLSRADSAARAGAVGGRGAVGVAEPAYDAVAVRASWARTAGLGQVRVSGRWSVRVRGRMGSGLLCAAACQRGADGADSEWVGWTFTVGAMNGHGRRAMEERLSHLGVPPPGPWDAHIASGPSSRSSSSRAATSRPSRRPIAWTIDDSTVGPRPYRRGVVPSLWRLTGRRLQLKHLWRRDPGARWCADAPEPWPWRPACGEPSLSLRC